MQVEKILLQRISQGDQLAFTEIVNRYWNNLYAQAMAYSKSAPIAQDIVQETFIRVWEKREVLPDIASLEDYLFIMVRNRIISELRKRILEPADINLYHGLEGQTPSPEEELSFKQSRKLVDQAIDLLPPQRKLIFQLSRTEGLSYAQIADKLGISKNTVKEHIVKALIFLRNYLHTHSDIGLILICLLLRRK